MGDKVHSRKGKSPDRQLRSRLTQGGRTFPWKPWVYGLRDSHPHLATHANILSPILSTTPYGIASACMGSSPTHHHMMP